jgi:hypothetical protein
MSLINAASGHAGQGLTLIYRLPMNFQFPKWRSHPELNFETSPIGLLLECCTAVLLPNFLDSVFWDVMLRWMVLPILLTTTLPSS